ncbi:MAG: Gfo/Idh/MocA family oxidoreductase [Akkermansiaceae bacterium]|nr:Gfo/Idh/MocA family oxidoreductase [Akkermansiaceae bacterium]
MSAPKILVIGTGEYVTGLVNGSESTSDKGAGIVALTLFDLRERGFISDIILAGSNGSKFPLVRTHFDELITKRYGLNTAFRSFPDDDQQDPLAWKSALQELEPGDSVLIFTPDDLHHEMAHASASKGLNVLVAKPIVKTVAEHDSLIAVSRTKGITIAMEVHKRWDPIYSDAREKLRKLGAFSYLTSYMSQPKSQLESFRAWAGKSSDISYYLNAHHIDFHCWTLEGLARPTSVIASASTGVAKSQGLPTEDSITLMVDWLNNSGTKGTAVYTASWIAAKAEVHSQQRFFALHHAGEVRVDQAHRGYDFASDSGGYQSPNPLFFRYTPDANGHFAGQSSYGYQSIADFILGKRENLATIETTRNTTAILEAGRRSLDTGRLIEL